MLEEPMEHLAHGVFRRRQLVGRLHLRGDLGFPEHHAVEPRRNAEEMRHRVHAFARVKVAFEAVRAETVKIRQQVLHQRVALGRARADVDLDAIARGEDHDFLDSFDRAHRREGFRQPGAGKRQRLPHFHRRGVVAEADDLNRSERGHVLGEITEGAGNDGVRPR